MAIDPAPGFRDELTAAIAVLDPQIEGLSVLKLGPLSPEAKMLLSNVLADKSRRKQLIMDAIAAMDVVAKSWGLLKDDGYPATPATVPEAALFAELQKEAEAIATAMKVFAVQPVAASIKISLGAPTKKVT